MTAEEKSESKDVGTWRLPEDVDVTMKGTSNAYDSGKLSGYSDHEKVEKIFDDYTGADNDEFMH
jgi:hypothetical protein